MKFYETAGLISEPLFLDGLYSMLANSRFVQQKYGHTENINVYIFLFIYVYKNYFSSIKKMFVCECIWIKNCK